MAVWEVSGTCTEVPWFGGGTPNPGRQTPSTTAGLRGTATLFRPSRGQQRRL